MLAKLAPERANERLSSFGTGWDHEVWAVGADLVLRVKPGRDSEDRRESVERDVRLLDLVHRHLSVPVGEVVVADPGAGALLQRRVPGLPLSELCDPAAKLLSRGEFVESLAQALGELRAVPLTEALAVAGQPTVSASDWHAEATLEFERHAAAFPVEEQRRIEAWLRLPVPREDVRMSLCHNDLGDEHLFVDDGMRLSGVIDWTDAVVGNPARDLALIMFDLGTDVAREVVGVAGWEHDYELWTSARWFAIRAGVWGIGQRVDRGDDVEALVPRLRVAFRA